jgi:hypothetical protein
VGKVSGFKILGRISSLRLRVDVQYANGLNRIVGNGGKKA